MRISEQQVPYIPKYQASFWMQKNKNQLFFYRQQADNNNLIIIYHLKIKKITNK